MSQADREQSPSAASAGQAGPVPAGLGTILARAIRLRCPVCGRGRMFRGLLAMNKRCTGCGVYYERASGYFLGSIYINYAVTALIASAVYLGPMIVTGRPKTWLLWPLVPFCLVFPLVFFRYARSLWLALDHYLSPIDPTVRLRHED